jgi:DNA-directed RNA polymerase specialized sigma24 family protein
MLSKLDRDQRQAFVLNLAHGFNVAEIADFQNRPPDEVEREIAQATSTIRRWYADQHTADQEEPFARAEMRERRRRQ